MLDSKRGPVGNALEEIREIVERAAAKAQADGLLPNEAELPQFTVEVPADTSHGDFATNVAMVSARAFKKSPKMIADAIISSLDLENTSFSKAEAAGPGFINFYVKNIWFALVVKEVLEKNKRYGRTSYGNGEKVNVEFVSANPTGPMHMGNARGGAIGDSLASAFDWAGYDATREFYINDAGNQIEKFGKSLSARYLQHFKGEEEVPFPEDGYHGHDIVERAEEYIEINGDKLLSASEEERMQALINYALPKNISKMKSDLEKYRIVYDVWFHESSLHESGAVKDVIKKMTEKGATYEKDGALWYKATDYGEEKDEVLVRKNGTPTYFAADIAYHANKMAVRGFTKCINVWGADHHGHVARLKGALTAMGLDGNSLDVVLMQLVKLTRNGELVKMSKRTGNAIALSDLLDEVPVDAARFFFNMREPGSSLDFDLDLAVEESSKNPVYYVQYAHARICSIIKNLEAEGIKVRSCQEKELCLLTDPAEIELIRSLASFPEEIIKSALSYDPARLTHYAVDLATRFHKFYNNCRVRCEDEALMQARLNLSIAAKQVIFNVLTMLKIEVPESM